MFLRKLRAVGCALWVVLPFAAQAAADDGAAPAVSIDAQAEASASQSSDAATADRARAQSTLTGATGGVHLVDAASGLAPSLRLQLGFDYFRGSDFLLAGDTNENLSGTLALGVTPAPHLELFATFATRGNSNNLGNPILIQIVGDMLIGVKGFTNVTPWLGLGADLRALVVNNVGDLGIAFDGTSLGLRFDATADLRRTADSVPLVLRTNLDYLFDNTGALVEGVEDARYDALPVATRRARLNEDRNLVSRIERLALGINRVDMLTFGLGAEAPLHVDGEWYVHPLVEWTLGVPVNRQGYNCLAVATTAGITDDDGCLAVQGMSAAPSVLTLGARVLPPLRGFSALLAFDIGVRGTATFVRELAPTRPWALLIAIGMAADGRPTSAAAPVPAAAAPMPTAVATAEPAPPRPRVRGVVLEAGSGKPIADAVVRYARADLNPQLTTESGEFISYELDPGEVRFEVSHPGYETAACAVVVSSPSAAPPPSAADAAPRSGLSPVGLDSPDGAAAASPASAGDAAFIPLRCELAALAQSGRVQGTVTGDANAPLAGANISVTGPVLRTLASDEHGAFALADLPVGDYLARVEAPSHLPATLPFSIRAGEATSLPIVLAPAPKQPTQAPQVIVTGREVKIRKQVMFLSNSAEIDERSLPLLQEIASVLNANPRVKRVQVQGHTDNRGEPKKNLALSQARAESVVAKLVSLGVDAARLDAKGYGDTRPLVPNLTAGNRAQNRRVQLIITDQ